MAEHVLTEPEENKYHKWAAACSCGCSWSSFPDAETLGEVAASHVEEDVEEDI
jgi:hypothetical protein